MRAVSATSNRTVPHGARVFAAKATAVLDLNETSDG